MSALTCTYRADADQYVVADHRRDLARIIPEHTAHGPAARIVLNGRFDAAAEAWVPRSVYAAGFDAVTAWALDYVRRHRP